MSKREKVGVVVSNKMDKTVVVEIHEKASHGKYGKIINRTVKFKAHDEQNVCNTGDLVRIVESRPLSKDKRWRMVEVLQQAETV